jgi:3-oxoacyl-[acyl-carrier protein] reductase
MNALAGKVALVTGSSRGIGAAIARGFAREGARVVVHGRDEVALARVRDDIASTGGDASLVVGDVTRERDVEHMRTVVEREFGPLDILVTNAGGSFTKPAPLEEITLDGWRASVEGNLTATFLTVRSFLPGMKQRRSGNVITISSSAARRPHPQSPVPYAAAKAGIQMLTQHLAAQVGPFGIRVNCIAPETILTEHNEQYIPVATQERLAAAHPLQRLGTPEDVAEAALFLASARSAWITGMIVDVAGGNVMV